MYFQLNAVQNKRNETLADFCKRMFSFIEENDVSALVVDIRNNRGGNNFLNKALIHEIIKCDKVNKKGSLFTVIGRRTGSAAKALAVDLEAHTATIFVGEPTFGKPNIPSEKAQFRLPYSGLTVGVSTYYWQHSMPWDRRIWIAPDIVAELSSSDFITNTDPAMRAVFSKTSEQKRP